MDLSRRDLLQLVPGAVLSAQARRDRPNLLVFVLDDLGARDLGFQGAADMKTPQIDALASNGAVFTNWYSNAPVCAPARASILSGRYPARAGVPTNGGELTPGMPSFGSLFQAAGYRTAAIGKWHLGSGERTCPNAHGFQQFYGFHSGCIDFYSHRFYWGEPRTVNYHDLWRNRTEIFEDGRYFTERITQETLAFVGASRGRPFAAYVAYNAPHYPMHAPAKYMERFAHLPLERRTYAAMVAAVDDGIGAIRGALARSGELENTIIVFVGDNGATTEKRAGLDGNYATAGSNEPYRGYKFSLFDGGMHVPCFIHWPARVKPGRITAPFLSMDLLPTLLAAAALDNPGGMDGRSFLGTLVTRTPPAPSRELFWTQNGQLAVRRGPWKLVVDGRVYDRTPEGAKPLTGADRLWLSNLDEDPGESKNLRTAQPNLVDELATVARKWQESLPGGGARKE